MDRLERYAKAVPDGRVGALRSDTSEVGGRTVLRDGPSGALRDLSGNGRRTLLAECEGYLTPASAGLFGGRRSRAQGGRDEHLSGSEFQNSGPKRSLRRANRGGISGSDSTSVGTQRQHFRVATSGRVSSTLGGRIPREHRAEGQWQRWLDATDSLAEQRLEVEAAGGR
jgi:hypothetical protein